MILHRQMIFKQVTKEETQLKYQWDSICTCCLVTLCKTLCDPMDMPGFPVLHNLPSWLKLMSIELTMPSFHLILCHPLLLPSIFPSIRIFSSELALCIRWPKDWSFSFSISPSSEYSGLIFFGIDWFRLFIYDEIYEPHGNQKPAKDSFNVDLFRPVKWSLF